jgi:hypothetical protein
MIAKESRKTLNLVPAFQSSWDLRTQTAFQLALTETRR